MVVIILGVNSWQSILPWFYHNSFQQNNYYRGELQNNFKEDDSIKIPISKLYYPYTLPNTTYRKSGLFDYAYLYF